MTLVPLITSIVRRPAEAVRFAGLLAALALGGGAVWAQQGASPPPAAATPAVAPGQPNVMLVFDGSGSMWGKVDGSKEPKFAVAREALRPALGKVAGKARLGLLSFGHRRQGACADIEVIAAPEQGAADRITGPLDKLSPKGKGPVAQALREAGKALAGKSPASIVLVNDNADNCQQDMCAAAEELGKAQIKVFAVGIGLEGDEPQRMACVAKASGGRFVNAMDAGSLTTALSESVELAIAGRIGAPALAAQPDKPKEEAKTPQALPANAPPGLALVAHLGSDPTVLAEGVRWRVTNAGGGVEFDSAAGEVFEPLRAGKYTVEVQAGLIAEKRTVEVGGNGPTRAAFQLPAGLLTATVRAAKAGEPMPGATLSLLPSADKKTASGAAPVWLGRAGETSLAVPPGDYVLRAEMGLARGEVPVSVAAGARVAANVVLAAGKLAVSALTAEDGEALDGVTFILAEDDPDAPQGRREIGRSAARKPEFVLPAGSYYVTARLGPNEVRSRIAVGAGDTVKKAIVLGLSKLTVNVSSEGAVAKTEQPVVVRVSRLDAGTREVARSQQARSEFLLAPGRYKIEVSAGGQNARAEGEVELKPGHNAQAAVKLDVAAVSLRALEGAGGLAASDAFWEIRDAKGRIVWRTSQPEPKALLAPGRYTVRSESRARALEKTVDLASGEVRTLELGP